NDINIPESDSWGSVLRGYGPDVRHMLHGYGDYLPGHLLVAGIFLAGILLLAFARRGRDPLFLLARGAALGYPGFLVIAPTSSPPPSPPSATRSPSCRCWPLVSASASTGFA